MVYYEQTGRRWRRRLRPARRFLTIDNARINPKARGGRYLRVCTRLLFSPAGFVLAENSDILLLAPCARPTCILTFEVPAPVPKRAKRAPTPSSTPPRATAKPAAPGSPFLPIKLP